MFAHNLLTFVHTQKKENRKNQFRLTGVLVTFGGRMMCQRPAVQMDIFQLDFGILSSFSAFQEERRCVCSASE